MEGIKGWAAALCVVAVGCTLIQYLAPKGGMGRIFRMMIAAFFLCCLVSPLLSLKGLDQLPLDLLPEEVQADMLQEKVDEQLKKQVSAAVEGIVSTALDNYHLKAEKIETNTDTSEDGSIYMKQIILYLDKQSLSKAATVKQVLEQRLGAPVVLRTAENEN